MEMSVLNISDDGEARASTLDILHAARTSIAK